MNPFYGLTNLGARGLAVDFSGSTPVIYATTAETSPNRLISLVDTGPAAAVHTLATAGVNQVFRGLSWAPESEANPRFYASHNAPSGFSLAWTTLLQRNYTLQYATNLTQLDWITITSGIATAPVMRWIDSPTATKAQRFYRVVLQP